MIQFLKPALLLTQQKSGGVLASVWGMLILLSGALGAQDGGLIGTGRAGGIIGTGLVFEDIIGTGSIGTVSQLGSVYVNGQRFEIDNNQPPPRYDGQPAPLRRGERIVFSHFVTQAGGLLAGQPHRLYSMIGPVQTYDQAGGLLVVMEQKIGGFSGVADHLTLNALETLREGEWVAVQGLRSSDGSFVLTAMDRIEPQVQAQLIAPLEVRSDGTIWAGNLRIVHPGLPAFSANSGEVYFIRGQVSGSVFSVEEAYSLTESAFRSAKINSLATEGQILRGGDGQSRIWSEWGFVPLSPTVEMVGNPGGQFQSGSVVSALLGRNLSGSWETEMVKPWEIGETQVEAWKAKMLEVSFGNRSGYLPQQPTVPFILNEKLSPRLPAAGQ